MQHAEIVFHGVSFLYETMSRPLFAGLELHLAAGWTGIVGANGAGKTTLLRLATGELPPVEGSVQVPSGALYCAQRTDAPPAHLRALLESDEGGARQLVGQLGLQADWERRWQSLSHGERKRAQIGAALWREPPVLAVDEPTNHIDAEARDLLCAALQAYRGVGLLVSHDRELLDALCAQCLFAEPPSALLRPGNYSQAASRAQAEEEACRRQAGLLRRERERLEKEAVRRRQEAARSQKRRSKRNLGKDNDARFKRNLARASGKDGQAGRLLQQMEGRVEQARRKAAGLRPGRIYELGIWVEGARSRRDWLFQVPAGALELGGGRCLHLPELGMRPDERIALVGPNGGGKSTLVRHLLGHLRLEAERLLYLPQELGAGAARRALERVRRLPGEELGRLMNVVSRLGSRPERLLESGEPSPGEVRKLLLAEGIARAPHLVLMDEPTNHLDLPSIRCLEEALEPCPCALLLVSHDRPFLARLTRKCWRLEWVGEGETRLRVEDSEV